MYITHDKSLIKTSYFYYHDFDDLNIIIAKFAYKYRGVI